MKLKYIRLDLRGLTVFILFTEHVMHDEIAKSIVDCVQGAKLVSAGFIEGHYMDMAHCCGSSVSLDLRALDTDTYELRKQFGIMQARS